MADGKVTIDTELDDSGAKKGIQGLDGLKSVAGGVTKAIAGIGAVAVAGAGAIVKSSTDAYASYEQLEGGIKKLYGNAGMSIEEYAQSVGKSTNEVKEEWENLEKAQNLVLENSQKAYETAGMSANQYMETASQFSASLIASLGGDVVASAEQTDVAMRMISDNVNTFGTNAEDVSNAIKGISKQNYTMLDNLKLGYGGTKSEMERLIEDANAWGEANGKASDLSIDSFSDCITAIQQIQEAQGIAGTTARESATTIEGSANMMKASWENLLVGIADDNADFDQLIQNFVNSVDTYAQNILPRVEIALNGVVDLISKLAPVIVEKLPQFINQMLPKLITAGMNIVKALVDAIIKSLPTLLQSAIELVKQLGSYIIQCLPMLIQAGFEIIFQLVDALADALPNLIPATIDMLLTILETLIDNVDMLIDASIKIIMVLADGIINALPILIEKVPTIIEKLLIALKNNAPKILQAGLEINKKLLDGIIKIFPQLKEKGTEIVNKIKDAILSKIASIKEVGTHIVTGLWQGISDKFGWLTGQLKSFAHNVTDKLKAFFGIHSPSRVMRDEVGQWLAKGVSLGFTENNPMNEINATMHKGMNKLSDLSLNYSANIGYNGVIDYDKMADAFSKSGMPITFKGREFGRIVRDYV